MTDDRPVGGADGTDDPSEEERAARLAALLSVDIALPARGRVPDGSAADVDETFRAFPAAERGEAGPEPVDTPLVPAAEHEPQSHAVEPDGGPVPGADPVPPRADRGWRNAAWFGALAVLIVSGIVLAYVGSEIVRDSTEGEIVSQETDPSSPGYEALVEATPTLVLFHDSGEGLEAVTVLTLPDPAGSGGGVILVPSRTVVDLPIFGEGPVEIAYDLGDPRVGAEGVGLLLGAAMSERVVVDDARWADLVEPVAPITLENPNELEIDGEVRFPLGRISLAAEDVGPYLSATVEGESDLARLFRHQLFWEAWLSAVRADGSLGAVPGEVESGIGRFVRTIAAGDAIVETLPVDPAVEGAHGDEPAFLPDGPAIAGLVRTLVPFPVAPAPGLRARVRVLNGTSDIGEASSVAADLTPAGVQIVLVGNATSLDIEETTVSYSGDEYRDDAEQIVEILGVGEVVEDDRPSDAVDITVTLGADHD